MVSDVTMETGRSEVVPLMVLEIWPIRSSTQPADSRASASWSQHSSMVSHIRLRPCRSWGERERVSESERVRVSQRESERVRVSQRE